MELDFKIETNVKIEIDKAMNKSKNLNLELKQFAQKVENENKNRINEQIDVYGRQLEPLKESTLKMTPRIGTGVFEKTGKTKSSIKTKVEGNKVTLSMSGNGTFVNNGTKNIHKREILGMTKENEAELIRIIEKALSIK